MPKSEQSLNNLLYEVKRIEEHRKILSEKKVRKIYMQLMKELNAFIGEEYVKYANEQGVLAYSTLRDRARQARFLEEVVAKVDSITPELKSEIMGLVETTYTKCYEGMGKAVASASSTEELASAMNGSLVKPEILKQSLNNNISKLTLPHVLEKHRQEIVYNIKQELTIGLLNGDRYEKMVRRLTDKLDISYKKATNIVRTESHRNIESGLYDCAENIAQSLEGSDLVSVCIWRTMKDERVRPNVRRKTKSGWKTYKSKNGADHVAMEGKTIRVGDFFVFPDGVKTKCPSKSGEARHDCNCRCFLEEEFAKINANSKTTIAKVTRITEKGVENSNESGIISAKGLKPDIQLFARIPKEKFTKYSLDPIKQPDKAKAFKEALGYSIENHQELIDNIQKNIDETKMVLKKEDRFGKRYEQVMELTGANGKKAKVCTAWIKETENSELRLTSAYVTKKRVK